jgi:hypothetical protein
MQAIDSVLTYGPGELSLRRRILISAAAFTGIVVSAVLILRFASHEPLHDRDFLGVVEGYAVWGTVLVIGMAFGIVQCLMLIGTDGGIVKDWRARLPVGTMALAGLLLQIALLIRLGLGEIGSG